MFGLRVALGTKKSSNLPTIYQVTYQQIKKKKKKIYIYIYIYQQFLKKKSRTLTIKTVPVA